MARDNYLKLKKFNVASVGRMAAIFGVVLGAILLLFSVGAAALGFRGGTSALIGIGIGLVLLVVSIVGLFVMGAVEAFIYNVIAKAVGPIKLSFNKDVLMKLDPLSYAKLSFVASIIVFGILGIFVSSILLATVGLTPGVLSIPISLVVAVFIFAIVFYGFVIPYVWALAYNWLAIRMGGVVLELKKGTRERTLERIGIWSYAKMTLALSVIVFILERVVILVVDAITKVPPAGTAISIVAGFIFVIFASIVVAGLIAWFYNLAAKRFGGIGVELKA